ncbi:MAG: DUF1501 domain-containing protein [Bacteroidota bacterium]
MKDISRRNFIKKSALTSAGSMLIPGFLKAYEQTNLGNSILASEKILVVIQLSGGNDGLNTIVPFNNDLYYELRPQLAIDKSSTLKATDELGFHPSMSGLKGLYDDGLLSIVNNVGYPNPDRSHFRSMDIWQTGSDAKSVWNTGWIGRYLDSTCGDCGKPHAAIEIDDSLSLSLKGEQIKGMAMRNPKKLNRAIDGGHYKRIAAAYDSEEVANHNLDYLYKTLIETVSSSEYLKEKSKIKKSRIDYPQNALSRDLRTIAELIGSGSDTKVYYASLSGFDTHVNQKFQHERLLSTYSESVSAFVRDLKAMGMLDQTMILTFSEFGRRVKQNASRGTDHGTANNLFIINGQLKTPGFVNEAPDLSKLDEGDLIHSIDFRRIYATLLNKWLDTDDVSILKGKFEHLNFI